MYGNFDDMSLHVLAFRNAKRCGSDKMWRVDEGYIMWRLDTHERHGRLRDIYFLPVEGPRDRQVANQQRRPASDEGTFTKSTLHRGA